jgi:nucleotide-binding universal stress UspA family protein
VVVGVDGSDQSITALRRGVRLATSLEGELEAVIAWHFPRDGFLYPPMTQWSPEHDAETVVRTAADTVFGDTWPDWFKVVVLQGAPAQVLIDQSAGAELLIVGSRGHGGIAGLLLGSVSAVCAAHAHCPVLIMHEKTTE